MIKRGSDSFNDGVSYLGALGGLSIQIYELFYKDI
jgi:hypothetical protein